MSNKADIISQVAGELINKNISKARRVIEEEYPFNGFIPEKRSYTDKEKFTQFCKDGFIDRYSGDKLVNPGMLRAISILLPNEFPFQKNWKMTDCHIAYWELVPTVDHIKPIALGGVDDESNWATTSMMHNQVKSNWSLEQLNWELCDSGNLREWDGLTSLFSELVETNSTLLDDCYIKKWYRLSKMVDLT